MMQKIKNAFSWLIEKVKAGVAWVRENRGWLLEQAKEKSRLVHKTLIRVQRQVWAKLTRAGPWLF